MAENEDGQERSEEPTGKRISESREKGNVPRSRELGTLLLLIVSAAIFLMLGPMMMEALLQVIRDSFIIPRSHIFDPRQLAVHLTGTLLASLMIFIPLFGALVVTAFIAGILLGGWNFSTQAMAPKFSKLNPITGFGRLFSSQGLIELAKSMAKFIIIATAAYLLLKGQMDDFLGLGREPLTQAIAHMADLLLWAFLLVSATLILLAVVDVPFQLWNYHNQLKMTKQEVKEEYKQSEGSGEVKAQQRRMQRELSQRRMMEAVPEADVIITNPTHYAVALKYEGETMRAPVLVAKGSDLIAQTIRELGEKHGVAILSAPPLARALYHSTEIDQPIPEGLYKAVAQVLAYIFHLKQGGKADDRAKAKALADLPIPEPLRRDQ